MWAQRVAEAFVELSDTLAEEFYLPAFLRLFADRCVEFLQISASGLILVDPDGRTDLVAASGDSALALQSLQLDEGEGPSVDCYRLIGQVACADLAAESWRWPRFAPAAQQAGFASVHAVPMRWRGSRVGVLNLFGTEQKTLPVHTTRLAQSMADIVTIALLQERSLRQQSVLTGQLQSALNSRVSVEQAKGLLAGRLDVDMDSAFNAMRGYARSHNLKLAGLAADLVADRSWLDEVHRWVSG